MSPVTSSPMDNIANTPHFTTAAGDIRSGAALRVAKETLDALWEGSDTEEEVIADLKSVVELLGGSWEPPDGSDGGYVPSDDKDPKKLADQINAQLGRCEYYDGSTLLDGPYKIWARAELWYTPKGGQNTVLLVAANREEQAPVVNALLHWGRTLVAADLPPYPGQGIGWHWSNISLGDIAVVDMWITSSGIAVQEQ